MYLTPQEKDKVESYLKRVTKVDKLVCMLCQTDLKVVPFFFESVQRGSALTNEAILVKEIALQCDNCGHLMYFKGSILDREEKLCDAQMS